MSKKRESQEIFLDQVKIIDLFSTEREGFEEEIQKTVSVLIDTNLLNQINDNYMIKNFLNPNDEFTDLEPNKRLIMQILKHRTKDKLKIHICDLNIIELFSKSKKHFSLWKFLDPVLIKIVPHKSIFQELWFYISSILTYLFNNDYIERRSDFKDFYIYCLSSLCYIDYIISDDKSFTTFFEGLNKLKIDFLEQPKRKDGMINSLKNTLSYLNPKFKSEIDINLLLDTLVNNKPFPFKSKDFLDDKRLYTLTEISTLIYFWERLFFNFKSLRNLKDNEFIDITDSIDLIEKEIEKILKNDFGISLNQILMDQFSLTPEMLETLKVKKDSLLDDYKTLEEELNEFLYQSYIDIDEEEARIASSKEAQFLKYEFEKFCTVKCSSCGLVQKLTLYYEGSEVIDSDRQMGSESEHRWSTEIGCENDECRNSFNVEYRIWEYPVGMILDGSETEKFGCEIIEGVDYQRPKSKNLKHLFKKLPKDFSSKKKIV